jgi:hypothetical protein
MQRHGSTAVEREEQSNGTLCARQPEEKENFAWRSVAQGYGRGVHVGHGGMNHGRRPESVRGAVNCSLVGMWWCCMVGVGMAPRCAHSRIRSVCQVDSWVGGWASGRIPSEVGWNCCSGPGPANGKVFSLIFQSFSNIQTDPNFTW